MTDVQPGFWSAFWAGMKSVFRWVGTKLVAPGVAVVIVIVAVVLVAMGFKELQVGGLLQKILGIKGLNTTPVDVASIVPAGRVDPNGKVIPAGISDSGGMTQVFVVPLQAPGLLSNPSTVTFMPPDSDKPVTIDLPTGVKNTDVSQVIVVSPGMYAVTVKDTSGIPSQTVDDLLRKYSSGA